MELTNQMTAKELAEMVGSKRFIEFKPDEQLPGGWVEVVATWPDAVEWQNHPQVRAYKKRGRHVGWDKKGNKIWSGE